MPGISWDLQTGVSGNASIIPSSGIAAGADNGNWVDCDLAEGQVYGEFLFGAAAGSGTGSASGLGASPSAVSYACKLQEADDSSGTNSQDIATQTQATDTNAAANLVLVRGQRTKRWVRCVANPTFTGGSLPYVPVCAAVIFQLRRANNLQT